VPWISGSKSRDAAELAIGYVLIFFAEWFPDSAAQRFLFWFTLGWVIVMTILARPNARTLGLRPANARSVWIVPAIVLVGALSVWMASQLHTLHGFSIGTLMGRMRGYLVWSLLQQFMLQGYFLLRLLRLMPGKAAAEHRFQLFSMLLSTWPVRNESLNFHRSTSVCWHATGGLGRDRPIIMSGPKV
jgi:hypothetical protein